MFRYAIKFDSYQLRGTVAPQTSYLTASHTPWPALLSFRNGYFQVPGLVKFAVSGGPASGI